MKTRLLCLLLAMTGYFWDPTTIASAKTFK